VLEIIERMRGKKDALEKELIGSTVLTKHGGNKLYTIKGICYDETPECTFKLRKENEETTYADYFLKRYGLKAKNMR
jgi:hypothetical protein